MKKQIKKCTFKVNRVIRMSEGNSKIVGDNVLIFSLPAVKTCLNCSMCKNTCYARKAEIMYPQTRASRNYNLELVDNDLDLLETLLVGQIQKKFKDRTDGVVRIHEAGDFINSDYIKMWKWIAGLFPNVKFWGYSKVFDIFPNELSELNYLPNVNIINSFINNKYLNFGKKEYIDQLIKDYNCFLCPATSGQGLKCNRDCQYCITGDKPVFYIH